MLKHQRTQQVTTRTGLDSHTLVRLASCLVLKRSNSLLGCSAAPAPAELSDALRGAAGKAQHSDPPTGDACSVKTRDRRAGKAAAPLTAAYISETYMSAHARDIIAVLFLTPPEENVTSPAVYDDCHRREPEQGCPGAPYVFFIQIPASSGCAARRECECGESGRSRCM
jgi:hypothetical protein